MKTRLNILIVEDCGVMQSVIRKTLLISGLDIERIDLADNGEDGLKLLEKEKYDLILLDINMPVMDGSEMIRVIRESPAHRDIPVLIVSADGQKERIRFYKDEEFEFMQKPFMAEELKEKVLLTLNGTEES
ncbi:MAG: response regulator [Balneolaceae bacterium]|nr:MAG: response regulator [Balneolaceae bacterium]